MSEPIPHPRSQVCIACKDLDADKAVVEKILLAALAKFNLYDNSDTSRVPHTIRSIVEGKGFGFGLGARVVGNFIFVDFNPRGNNPPKFAAVHDFILDGLKNAFQVQLEEIGEDNQAYCKTHSK